MLTEDFGRLVEITKRLRRECPWDREQTHASIRHSLVEEAYEVIETIDRREWRSLADELGDILLHVLFHANIAEESAEFTLGDVIAAISEKLIRRHPHIYGPTAPKPGEPAMNAGEVIGQWERLKLKEGRTSLLDGIPQELPALLRASRIGEKASSAGFDWPDKSEVWKKVVEETEELHAAAAAGDAGRTEAEFGDLLFALVNYARFLGVNPEMALRGTIGRFIGRFHYMEGRLREGGRGVHDAPPEELDALWNEAKRLQRSAAGSEPPSA